jgi:hypothetical protein
MRFAADENLDGRIWDGLLVRFPELDIVRVQDTPMFQSSDPDLLDWLAKEGRILLTHDIRTLPGFVYDRVRLGLAAPGIIEINRTKATIGQILDDLEVVIAAGKPEDFENQVRYIPMS